MSELTVGLKGILDQTVEAHNRLMAAYQEAAAAEGAASSGPREEARPSIEMLDAAADLNAAYTKLGRLILRLDPDALA